MSKLREMNIRTVHIQLVDGTKINGQVNINHEPGYDRLSDLIGNSNDSFLIVFNAFRYEEGKKKPVKHRTIFVNKSHILWSIPEDDQK